MGSENRDGEDLIGEKYGGVLGVPVSKEVAVKQRGSGERVAFRGRKQHVQRPRGRCMPDLLEEVACSPRFQGGLSAGSSKWITRMISGVRDGEGLAKDLVGYFPMDARELLKVVELGRFLNTVLRQQCAGWPGGGGQDSMATSFWEC